MEPEIKPLRPGDVDGLGGEIDRGEEIDEDVENLVNGKVTLL